MATRNDRSQALQRAWLRGETLTPVRAGLEFNYWRLGSLVHRLRRRGWPIEGYRTPANGMSAYRLRDGWRPDNAG